MLQAGLGQQSAGNLPPIWQNVSCSEFLPPTYISDQDQVSQPRKRRSRRLRKKLHIGEFQEFGCEVQITLRESIDQRDEDSLLDAFLLEVMEPRSLVFGGALTDGYIAYRGRGSVSEEDRKRVMDWLAGRPEIATAQVGELVNAWYPP